MVQGILLTNKIGGYFLSGIKSRYEGFFFRDSEAMYKIIDEIKSGGRIRGVSNNFFNLEISRKGFKENYFMPHGYNSLIYETDKKRRIDLYLDCRESYDTSVWGKFYVIFEEKGKIIVKFIKKEEETEQYALYLVVDKAGLEYSKTEKWVKKHYTFDENRKSHPYECHVYSALRIKGKKVVFSAGKDKDKAIEENNIVLNKINDLKKKQKEHYKKLFSKIKIKDKDINTAYKNALASIDNLYCKIDNVEGIYAGLPWFFQFWSRDELISLKALKDLRRIKQILFKHLEDIVNDGRLINIRYPIGDKTNADGIAWLFKRLDEIKLNKKEKDVVSGKIKDSIASIKKHFMKEGLIYNRELETWMDTNWDMDTREGFRIEIQAMFLFMLKSAFKLTNDPAYQKEEEQMRQLVRDKFWNGMKLADGLDDFTARPNVFIAAYFYPELLTKEEWSLCFQHLLSKLWLDWGGLSTIDKKHHLFHKKYSGEIPVSYHRGDSWFWINNLAALVMHRVDNVKFKEYIDKIVKSSVKDIFDGIIGSASELSSAKALKSEGSLYQAWSNAMFIELIDELF